MELRRRSLAKEAGHNLPCCLGGGGLAHSSVRPSPRMGRKLPETPGTRPKPTEDRRILRTALAHPPVANSTPGKDWTDTETQTLKQFRINHKPVQHNRQTTDTLPNQDQRNGTSTTSLGGCRPTNPPRPHPRGRPVFVRRPRRKSRPTGLGGGTPPRI